MSGTEIVRRESLKFIFFFGNLAFPLHRSKNGQNRTSNQRFFLIFRPGWVVALGDDGGRWF